MPLLFLATSHQVVADVLASGPSSFPELASKFNDGDQYYLSPLDIKDGRHQLYLDPPLDLHRG